MLGPLIKVNWKWSNRCWMARVNIGIFGINELKWMGMGEFNSDDHYINYCRKESIRRNGVALSQQESKMKYLDAISKMRE